MLGESLCLSFCLHPPFVEFGGLMLQLIFLALEAQFAMAVAQWILGLPLFVLARQAAPVFFLLAVGVVFVAALPAASFLLVVALVFPFALQS